MRWTGRFRPSPALVVASVALLVALGGTSVAAVALVPRNSVGSEQVIDGSLKSTDFKPGQVLAGSDVVSRSLTSPVTLGGDKEQAFASLAIAKPGAYVIWARAQLVTTTADGGVCRLVAHGVPNAAGGTPDLTTASSILDDASVAGNTTPTLWMSVVHGFASGGGSVDLYCAAAGKSATVRAARITAVRLGGDKG